MYQLQLTLETPAENLAIDEALLDAAVEGELPGEVLRLWEPARPFVVLGRSSRIEEVSLPARQTDGVPVLRRCSGGAAVVAGPGCLIYAIIASRRLHPELAGVDRAHEWVLGRIARALQGFGPRIARQGSSDPTTLAAGAENGPPRKFSGNSLRLKRDHLLYHGTILYDFPLERITRWLGAPARTPEYRAGRSHEAFVVNCPASAKALRAVLIDAWQAHELLHEWPRKRTEDLAAGRYATIDW